MSKQTKLYDQIEESFLASLNEFGAIGSDNKVSGIQVVENILRKRPDFNKNSVLAYMSRIVSEGNTQIRSGGHRGGYWLEVINSEAKEKLTAEVKQTRILEKQLYPIVKMWAIENLGFDKIKDVSDNKAGGPWGNTDLAGLRVFDDFGFYDVEILSIEVKPTIENWERMFFEATSHKRFSNFSYFAFRTHGPDEFDQTKKRRILEYAERYQVGLIHLDIPREMDKYIKDFSGDYSGNDGDLISRIEEIYAAPNTYISTAKKINYLKDVLGLNDKNAIRDFGIR